MINSESGEVLGHMSQPLSPPAVVIFGHLVPVVSWEAPVLSIFREKIWRSTSLLFKSEQFWLNPSVNTLWVDSNSNISLHTNTLTSGIVSSLLQLQVEVVLHKEVKGNLVKDFALWVSQCFDLIPCNVLVFSPLAKVTGVVFISEHAEEGIRSHPKLVGLKPLLESSIAQEGILLSLIDGLQHSVLEPSDSFIINLSVAIQSLLLLFDFFQKISILSESFQMDVHWVQSKDTQ
mmetsp:Transcript_6139/g.8567  ORF Transcript_6139/g.8567 Transcript_6139/m.8567 type:complete len:233 (+) Transcript_6139:1141-1839(+)